MIIWDANDPYGGRGEKCVMCTGRLVVPYVLWEVHLQGGVNGAGCRCGDECERPNDCGCDFYAARYFCARCCVAMSRGFSIDMRRVETARKVERLGFPGAGKQAAIGGGFLYTTGTSNKQ
jgi:hypothetical protein